MESGGEVLPWGGGIMQYSEGGVFYLKRGGKRGTTGKTPKWGLIVNCGEKTAVNVKMKVH